MIHSDAALSPFGAKTKGPTIHDLPAAAREWLEQNGTLRRYRRDEPVQRHMEPPRMASWLQTGRLRSVVYLSDGAEQHAGWVMPDELFGIYNQLLPDAPSRSHLIVDTDEARILHFSSEVLLQMMRAIPEARLGIVIGLSRRSTQLHDVMDISGPRSLIDKIRVVLAWWSNQFGQPALDGTVELWVSQTDLANGVGGSRQRVHKELNALRDQGELDLAYRKVRLRPLFFERLRLLSQ